MEFWHQTISAVHSVLEDVAVRAELVGVAPPADYAKFFDYSIAKKIYGDLKRTGWKPTP